MKLAWVVVIAVAFVLAIGIVALQAVRVARPSYAPPSARAAGLTYHRIWTRTLDANADSTPIVVQDVAFPGGHRKTVIIALAGNNGSDCDPGNPVSPATTYAYNASNGHLFWSRSTTGPGRCTTAAPAVSGTWVYSAGLDGLIHKYSLTTGHELRTGGWPIPLTRMPDVEKASANLKIHDGYLYGTTSGFTGTRVITKDTPSPSIPGRESNTFGTVSAATSMHCSVRTPVRVSTAPWYSRACSVVGRMPSIRSTTTSTS